MTNRIRLSILAVAVVLLAALACAAAAAPARKDARSAAPNYKEKAFVAHSRLIDVHGILCSLQNVYGGIRPLVAQAGAGQSARIGTALEQLTRFVDGIYAQGKAGTRFTPKQADLLGSQAQTRANAIAGQISQVAGVLGVELQA